MSTLIGVMLGIVALVMIGAAGYIIWFALTDNSSWKE